ncbi:MAG: sensor histidine kinase [Patescibacteria group bacterium]
MVNIFQKFKNALSVRGRLHRKVMIMMLLTSVLPIIFLGFLALVSLNTAHRIDVADIESNLINQKTEEIKTFLKGALNMLELRVTFPQVTDIEIGQQHYLLGQLLAENTAFNEISFVSLNGRETSKQGRLSLKNLADLSRLQKFLEAKAGKNYISPVYFTLSGPMITIAAPVKNSNNVIISVLTAELDLKGLEKIINKSILGNAGYLYLIDQDGFLVVWSEKNNTPPTYAADLRQIGFTNQLIQGESFLGADKQARYRSFFGKQVVGAGEFLSDFNLGVVAEWPVSDADNIIATVRNQIIVVSLIVLILTLLFSLFLAGQIVSPIKTLESSAELIAAGKFEHPVQISTHDEIEDLGRAFNKMMEGLKRLEELKNEFVFIAAHEIRTPVTAIKGYISMVVDKSAGKLDEETSRFLGEVKKASDRLNNLVNDLLQIARSEAGRLEIKVTPTEVTEPVKAVLAELKVLADEKSISLVYEPRALPKVLADPARLKEVLVNLVGNAIKYTLGAGAVTISQEIIGKEIITHVADTGIGIPLGAQQKLFEKFYRVPDERTREITGTGLGLFIVKEIIERMNGRIWVESESEKGSVFSFGLPIVSIDKTD